MASRGQYSSRATTTAPVEDDEPQWTPDGKRIVFTRFDPARELGAIFTVRSNGHDLQQITPSAPDGVQASSTRP